MSASARSDRTTTSSEKQCVWGRGGKITIYIIIIALKLTSLESADFQKQSADFQKQSADFQKQSTDIQK